MRIDIDLKQYVDNSYPIEIGALPHLHFDKKVAVITNPKVAGLHMGYLLDRLSAKELYFVTVPDGEDHKNLSTVEYILDRLFEHRLERGSLLIAFGGGVIGDMTGFSASIYQRGIEFIQIPTTLLAQVDASVGGKTGVNNRFGKNLIGSFYQPSAVYIDTYFLTTLPKREFSAGVAEIVKMAVTFDSEFFEWLENSKLESEAELQKAIKTSVEIKANVVKQDEKEAGIRAALNYGHTFAHVIEKETSYERFLHGEAVAIGMCMANDLAVEIGLMTQTEADRVKSLLRRFSLPTEYEIKNPAAFYESFFLDKKSKENRIRFVLPRSIGDFEIRGDIDKETVLKVLKKYSG